MLFTFETQWRTGKVVILPDGKWTPLEIRQYVFRAVCGDYGDNWSNKMLYTCSFFFQLVPEFSNLCEGITQENDCMNRSCWKTTRTRNNETIKANW